MPSKTATDTTYPFYHAGWGRWIGNLEEHIYRALQEGEQDLGAELAKLRGTEVAKQGSPNTPADPDPAIAATQTGGPFADPVTADTASGTATPDE